MHERRAGTAAAIHASHTPHIQRHGTNRGDPPTPHRSRTPRPSDHAPRIAPPSGEGKPRHAAISERETNAKRRKQAAALFLPLRFFRLYPHLFRIFQNAPQCPKFALQRVFSVRRYNYTTHTPNAARAHFAQSRLYNLHNTRRTCTILTFS